MTPQAPRFAGSVSLTHGVRVAVAPSYLPEHSHPSQGRYVFGYRIRITNESGRRLKLISRRWVIGGGGGQRHEGEGGGGGGQQPAAGAGGVVTDSSFFPLAA